MAEFDFLSLIVNSFVALGTILLAVYAYKNIKITQSQLESFEKQMKISISQNQPILTFESFLFRQNELNIPITNIGTQPAFDIGFSTICLRVDKVRDREDVKELSDFKFPHVTEDDVKDYFAISDDQQLIVSDYDPKNILAGKKRYPFQPIVGITYLRKENGESILCPKERVIFHQEPVFCIDNDFKNFKYVFLKKKDIEVLNKFFHRGFNFKNISEIYRENNVRYVLLRFDLFCKDLVENEIYQNDIVDCIVDLNEDASIEDALTKPRKLTRYHLSHQKLVKDIGYEPKWVYEETKYKSHIFSDSENKKLSSKRAKFYVSRKND